MRERRCLGVAALVMACAIAAYASGVEIDGTVEIGAQLLPALDTFAEFSMTISGKMWEVETPVTDLSFISEQLISLEL